MTAISCPNQPLVASGDPFRYLDVNIPTSGALWHFEELDRQRERARFHFGEADGSPFWMPAAWRTCGRPSSSSRTSPTAQPWTPRARRTGGSRRCWTHPCTRRGDSCWRDPEAFPDADKVILDRERSAHIGFGTGPHRCLGSHLARKQMHVAFEEWHRRIPEYRVAADVPITERGGLIGLDNLPLASSAGGGL